jgi:starch phosphorylase
VTQIRKALSLDTLTIGFARRFATYKRANLILQDIERIGSLVNDPQVPIQFIFAGKAHPRDLPGKDVLQEMAGLMRDPRFAGKVLFVEDYDINVARHIVQGVDVWLNTPRKPMEASGTSGMKAAMNGALNLSIADGWWPEGHDGDNGWVIEGKDCGSDQDCQDREDALALYHLLEEQVVPAFYDRDAKGVPRGWIRRMKEAIATITPRFSSDRMARDYCQRTYLPLMRQPVAAASESSDD